MLLFDIQERGEEEESSYMAYRPRGESKIKNRNTGGKSQRKHRTSIFPRERDPDPIQITMGREVFLGLR